MIGTLVVSVLAEGALDVVGRLEGLDKIVGLPVDVNDPAPVVGPAVGASKGNIAVGAIEIGSFVLSGRFVGSIVVVGRVGGLDIPVAGAEDGNLAVVGAPVFNWLIDGTTDAFAGTDEGCGVALVSPGVDIRLGCIVSDTGLVAGSEGC